MLLGRVIGKVVSTVKYPALSGIKLFLVRIPADDPHGKIEIAADSVCAASQGDLVYLIDSSEAAASLRRGAIPVDLAIVGLVTHCYREEKNR